MSAVLELVVDQVVKVGTGKVLWRVAGFWTAPSGELLVDLERVDRWDVHTSVAPGRCIPV